MRPLEWGAEVSTKPHPEASEAVRQVRLAAQADLTGRLLRRYKRFLVDIETPGGATITVHCPNPGSMKGVDRAGSQVRCSTSRNPRRKLRHTLEMIRVGRIWVGLHTLRANQLAARALGAGAIPDLRGYAEVKAEVAVGGGSRLDFRLTRHPADPRPAYVEVKSVTMAEGRRARFPDAVTERGQRHLKALARLHRAGARAVLLFLVQRGDCEWVEPADDIDPAYGRGLRSAAAAGVEILAVRARVTAREIRLEKTLPVLL
jgi:sugar fermentation stimulation protein A